MAFADRLKEHRIKMDLTQGELGDKIGVSQKTISSWETGRSEPTMKEFTALCNLFDCTLSDLSGTRERKTGEITMQDVYTRLKSMDLTELSELKSEIDNRIAFTVELRKTKIEHELTLKRLKEYEKRLKELGEEV